MAGNAFRVGEPIPLEVKKTVELEFEVEYSSPWAAASVMMVAWSSWLPSDSAVTVTPLVTPSLNRFATIRTSLPPIADPGRHTIVLAFHADGSAEHIVSLTNWTVGDPVWNDGNDFSSFTAAQLSSLETAGGLRVRYLRRGGRQVEEWLAAAAIRVEAHLY